MIINKSISELYSWDNNFINDGGADCILPLESSVYFHVLYSALTKNEIDMLKNSYKGTLPEELIEFYQLVNGARIFSREYKISEEISIYQPSISIFGIPNIKKVRTDHQPLDIRIEDLSRPQNCPNTWLFFAAYFYEPMITMFFDTAIMENGKHPVYANIKGSLKIIKRWDSFEEWFSSEIIRMSKLFDKNGKLITDEEMIAPFI